MVLRPAKVPDGVLVSKDALTMLEGQWGVNRLRLNREMAWTPIEIIDENRDQAIVKSLEENRLRAYDEVEIQEGSSGQND
jgi:hypothetical protein